MGRYFQKKIGALVIFVLASVVCEAITFHLLVFGLLPTHYLISFAMTLVVASIIFLVPGHVLSAILYSLVLFLQCAVSVVNVILYRIHGDLFTTDLLAMIDEARYAMNGGFVVDFSVAIPFVALFIVALALKIYVSTRKERRGAVNHRRYGALVLACVAVFIGVASLITAVVQIGGLSRDGERNIFGVSVRENFDSLKFKVPFFRSFGTFSLIYRNILLNTQPSTMLVGARTLDETMEYFMQTEQQSRFGFFCYEDCDEHCDNQEHFSPDAGNNLLVIMLESFEDFMIHKQYTPALYGLQQQSIVFDNFHGHHKTDVAETSVILGSYPTWTNIVSSWPNGGHTGDTRNPNITQEFSFSLPSVLGAQGYGERNFFHNNMGRHYSREFTHTAYGFDGAYFLEDFKIGPDHDNTDKVWRNDWQWHVPEKDFFKHAIDEILPQDQDDPFFSFITTTNAHGTYVWHDNLPDIYYEKFDLIQDKDFAGLQTRLSAAQYLNFKIAMAKAMVADDGVQYLLDELVERGMENDTTILAFADHNAYGNSLSFNMKQVSTHESSAYKIPAFLYSPRLAQVKLNEEPLVVDKFMVHFDLLPTLFDVLGVEVNPRKYLGFHAFDERENVVVSRLGLIFNDKFMTDGMNILWSCPSVTQADLNKFRNVYLDKINRWGHVNNMYSPSFRFQSDFGGDSLLP